MFLMIKRDSSNLETLFSRFDSILIQCMRLLKWIA
ncbi:hypothetical protein EZS27_042643, partial [termite gut metagenome]